MKRIAIIAILLVSIAFLGCVRQQSAPAPSPKGEQPPQLEQPPSGETPAPQLEEQVFESEEAAFDTLAKELEGVEDLGAEELEKALQE
jgi:hypothetical protein